MNKVQGLEGKAHCLEGKNERQEANRGKRCSVSEESTSPYMCFLSISLTGISLAEGVCKQQNVGIASWTAVQVFKDVGLHH